MAESDKREAVLAAGRSLLLKQGFRATSMEAIAAEAGIAKATLYKYYGDKDAVFVALATELLVTVHGAFRARLGEAGSLTARVSGALCAQYLALDAYMGGSEYADELLDVHHRRVGAQVQAAEAESRAALVAALRAGGVREPERVAGVLEAAAYGIFRKGRAELVEGIVTMVEGVLRGV